MKRIEIYENGINIVFEITDENEAKLLHFSALPFDEAKTASYMVLKTFRPVEIQASGIDRPDERHGNKYIVTLSRQQIYRDRSGLENEVQGLP